MRYEVIGDTGQDPKIAILVPRIQVAEITKHYLPHLELLGEDVMVANLHTSSSKKKTPAIEIKEYLNDLLPNLKLEGIEMLVVTHPDYFKILTKRAKTDASIGDICDCALDDSFKVTYCPNYGRIFFDPDKMKPKIKRAFDAVFRWAMGDNSVVGKDIIHFAKYPKGVDEISKSLDRLLEMDCDLTCDIEGFGLKHYDAGVGTITFCWNQNEGIAFSIDYSARRISGEGKPLNAKGHYGRYIKNQEVRMLLRDFFYNFQKKMIYHNICYDVYVMVYQLFMEDILDQAGMLEGLQVLLKNWDCTQLITYLATNSCAGNELGLKIQAQEYAGNYAQADIHDIRLIKEDDLLKYNLIDGLSTWFVYNKNRPIMLAENQDIPYQTLFRPAVIDIIQMQLTGMPINMEKVVKLNDLLQKESNLNLHRMNSLKIVQSFMDQLKEEMVIAKNLEYKKKVITVDDLGSTKSTIIEFNPNSPKQLQRFLYSEDFLGLPVLDYTDTKQPSTGADTLEKLVNHTTDPEVLKFLNIIIEFKASAIILSTFLPAFLKAVRGKDDWHYLFGNFRLGGTASGRLSSNGPNLQNIPSGGATAVKKRLAKLIKDCFEAPPGWLFVGLDFDSLEDKISAVTTNDPEKIKVYSDGYDGHCIRALKYFGEHMPDIELLPDGEQALMAIVGDKEIYFHSNEEIEYMGQKLLGSELLALINK